MDKVDNRDISGQMMTMPDVAEALKVSEKTVSRMLQDGSLPGFKVANQWRFYREDFYRWIDEKRNEWGNRARAGLASMLSNEMESVPLSRLTNPDLIITSIPKVPRDSILKILAEPLVDQGISSDPDKLFSGLRAREDMMSTGVGGGIAIPHLRNPADLPVERPVMVLGICPEGADWRAFDRKPVNLFLLPLSGDEVVHLRMLAAIRRSLIFDGIFDAIVSAETPQDVMREIMKIEVLQQSAAAINTNKEEV